MNNSTVVDLAAWTTGKVRAPKLPRTFAGTLEKVRPLFTTWMHADTVFEKNTQAVAEAIHQAFDLFRSETPGGTRVDFARYFDSKIPEGAVTRDLGSNATYNRLNYLIAKAGAIGDGPERAPRVPITEKRKKIHSDWLRFQRQHKKAPIALPDVEALLKQVLAELWTEDVADEVLAA